MSSDGDLSSAFAKHSPEVTTTPTNLAPRSTAASSQGSSNPAPGVRSRPVAVAQRREELEGFLKELAEAQARAPPLGFRKINSRAVRSKSTACWESVGFLHLTLAMALLSLALVSLMAIIHSTATPPVEAAKELVTYGSVIKLQHERTKARLHSHDVPYGSGSGQQSVTAFPSVEDANSYWRVEIVDDDHEQGDVIPNGAIISLQHVGTRKWLHSGQHHQSPLSGNLEVSACEVDDEQPDSGDNWKLEIQGSDPEWALDQKVRLRHVDTDSYLHSHKMMYNQLNQQEVCGVTKKNADNLWSAAEGIYFRPKDSSVE